MSTLHAARSLPILAFVLTTLASPVSVRGRSMSPTLNDASAPTTPTVVLLNRLAPLLSLPSPAPFPSHSPSPSLPSFLSPSPLPIGSHPSSSEDGYDEKGRWARGTLIQLTNPHDPTQHLLKRLIGLPHDRIIPHPHTDPRLSTIPSTTESIRIPKGMVWVEGDDPYHSHDSHAFGPVPIGLIHGTVEYVLWPPSLMGRVGHGSGEWRRRVIPPRVLH